jgi:hypothetical protein
MEAARTSETLVNFYQTTRCYNPEDSNLHTHRRENLKSYSLLIVFIFETLAPMRITDGSPGNRFQYREGHQWITGLGLYNVLEAQSP